MHSNYSGACVSQVHTVLIQGLFTSKVQLSELDKLSLYMHVLRYMYLCLHAFTSGTLGVVSRSQTLTLTLSPPCVRVWLRAKDWVHNPHSAETNSYCILHGKIVRLGMMHNI